MNDCLHKFMFLNKANNYLISEFLRSYFFVIISLTLLLWISQATRLLDLVTESGNAVEVYAQYTLLLIPKIISKVAIISFIISAFISILKLKTNNEFNIYWLSGVSKIQVCKTIIKISFIPLILTSYLYIYLAPSSSFKSRIILGNSKFTMINALVKEKNFNTPLPNLTIFVDENDGLGNLKKIFIYEKDRTIIAKKGKVLKDKDKNYLQLLDGETQEKSKSGEISIINFNKTLFDLSNKSSANIKTPKFSERSIFWLFKETKKSNLKKFEKNNLLEEIHSRLFKPFYIIVFAILSCFLLYSNEEKIKKEKLRFGIFSISIFLLIFLEVAVNISVINIYTKIFFYILPFFLMIFSYLVLLKFLNKESI